MKRAAGGGNADRSNRLELYLADVLPGFRLVGGRRAADVQKVFNAADARHLQDGFLNGGDLVSVVHLAPNRNDAGLDIEIDLSLRQITIAQDLAFRTVAQGQISHGGRGGSQRHHPLGEGRGGGAGPPPPLVQRAPATAQSGGRPIGEYGASGAATFRIEEINRDRTTDGADDDRERGWPTARRQPLAGRLCLLTDLGVDRFLSGGGELPSGVSGTARELFRGPADPIGDLATHLLEVNLLQVRHPASPPLSPSRPFCFWSPGPGCHGSERRPGGRSRQPPAAGSPGVPSGGRPPRCRPPAQ